MIGIDRDCKESQLKSTKFFYPNVVHFEKFNYNFKIIQQIQFVFFFKLLFFFLVLKSLMQKFLLNITQHRIIHN